MSLVVDGEGEEVDPNPQKGQRDPLKDLERRRCGRNRIKAEGRSGQSAKSAKYCFWNDDSFEVALREKPGCV